MTQELIPTEDRDLQAEHAARVGQAANEAAARHVFADYQVDKAENTLRRQLAGLALFAEFLVSTGALVIPKDTEDRGEWFKQAALEFGTDPERWRVVTWGLVKAFYKWMLDGGYSVTSANVRLSTIRKYAELATNAGTLSEQQCILIRNVKGKSRKAARNYDKRREEAGVAVRVGSKKQEAIVLDRKQAAALKAQPDTPQGRRDRLLVCLMLDLGLRVGEVAALNVGNFDLKMKRVVFYRPKVGKVQTHDLVGDLLPAARAYIQTDALAAGPLLRTSRSDGRLHDAGMSERAITERVRRLGADIGAIGLSAHDLRHTWATWAARSKTPLDRLKDAGGWSSLAMPMLYIEAAKIANQGVILEEAQNTGSIDE